MVDLSVKIGDLTLKNPILPGSGTFSSEIAQIVDVNRLGALVAKTVSRESRIGNPTPRVAELEAGMINEHSTPGAELVHGPLAAKYLVLSNRHRRAHGRGRPTAAFVHFIGPLHRRKRLLGNEGLSRRAFALIHRH